MTRSLAHRGPDGSGIWRSAFRHGDEEWEIALGHTRLSILDLSERGRQPMSSTDGSAVISYNGEVYNFRALRDQLCRLGHEFRSGTDTEVILAAYREWGTKGFPRLEGMFAFALWDAVAQRLLLVRDRLGIKPLFYRWADGILTFGSEIRALRAHGRFRPRLDRSALAEYLRLGWITGEHTLYQDTFRLLPGHILTWQRGAVQIDCYWKLTHVPLDGEPTSFEAAVDQLELALGNSVEGCLISDVPLGAFLSGGIDSSAVVALMKERARGPVRTFSIGFNHRDYDEAPFARAVARHLRTEHTELYVDRDAAIAALEELPRVYDEPLADRSSIPTLLLSQLTRRHVTVALSGDGGDELFGGYDRYQKLARLVPALCAPTLMRRPLEWVARVLPDSPFRKGLQRLAAARTAAELAEGFLADSDDDLVSAATGVRGPLHARRFIEVFQQSQALQEPRRAMYAEACTYMTDDVLVKVDRASMSIGLEVRVPVLERSVAELACSLPYEYLTHGGLTKAPLRALAYRRVPRQLLERPKQGFDFPIRELLGHELDHWTQTYLARERIRAEGLLDPTAVERLVSSARHMGTRGDARLWRLLSFERWLAEHHPTGFET